MGQGLPKAVSSVVVKRGLGGKFFRVGLAEMNGMRLNMEDAHVIFTQDRTGFFGVFDGHGGAQCSAFVARRLVEELNKNGVPPDDAAVTELSLRLDREFLDLGVPSGSTGTFAIVESSAEPEGRVCLRVGNIGDSRVLLGRADGTMVEGQGTDGGITTDHKPDHPDERARIMRTGGTVEMVMGVARVNGDLAVSRAFGDAVYKQTGGPGQADHPVSAAPELTTLHCDASDFLVLVCDGVSEGDFPNREVVKLAAQGLRTGGADPDPGRVAASIVRKALQSGSQDNISCMIVLFNHGEGKGHEAELQPGPFQASHHAGFRAAYAAMADRADLSLEQAVEMRYEIARKMRAHRGLGASSNDKGETAENAASLVALREELAVFGAGPPDNLVAGSAERVQWFKEWLDGHPAQGDPDPRQMSQAQVLDLIQNRPDLLALAQAQGYFGGDSGGAGSRQRVRVAEAEQLRKAVGACPSLKWTDAYLKTCGRKGVVVQNDDDGTSQVRFEELGITAWFPTCVLTDTGDEDEAETNPPYPPARSVRVVGTVGQLQTAVEAISSLTWCHGMKSEKLELFCGQIGCVQQEDPMDGTSQVVFGPPCSTTVWLPTSVLQEIDDDEEDSADSDQKRQRTT
mmetsp:Transcript_129647/g.276553  ORF Transcript_129647/g.276553 Transcript_129647/m.276553 type:complete len:627 (+) Transcript_129647:85-1965(+)